MSLILDALRKSEQERRQIEPSVPAPLAGEAVAWPRRYPHPFAVVTVLVSLILIAGGYWALQGGTEATPTSGMEPSNVSKSAPPAPVADAKPNAAPSIARAPELTANPFVSKPETSAVRDLAHEARVPRTELEPSPPAAPEPVAVAPPPATPAPAAGAARGTIKFLRAMPPEFQRALPELVVNIHIYAPRAAERILYINNRQYHAGDRVRDDVVVEEIVEDGAVLSYRGERFKLPRPS